MDRLDTNIDRQLRTLRRKNAYKFKPSRKAGKHVARIRNIKKQALFNKHSQAIIKLQHSARGANLQPKKTSLRSVAKSTGKKIIKKIPFVGLAATAYFAGHAAYSVYSKTGSIAKAATAGGDELTFGAVTELSKPITTKNTKHLRLRKRAKIRSVQSELAKSKRKTKSKFKTKSIKRKAVSVKRAGATFKRTRVVNGKRINETVRNHRYKR